MSGFVLVGLAPNGIKALGPFDTADEARQTANDLGNFGAAVDWRVVELQDF